MGEQSHIFSIGYGNKHIETFIQELKSFDIKYLIDIRSVPFSRFNKCFSQDSLKYFVEKEGIGYVFMGDELGGRPEDISCYTEGKVDYDKLKTKEFFINGLNKLKIVNEKGINTTIMCTEKNPTECHRTKLIGIELGKIGINLRHIVGIEKEKSQNQVIFEMTEGNGLTDLFGQNTFTSKKQYL